MPSLHRKPGQLTSDEIDAALYALDVQIGMSDLLMSVAPIRLMSVGGAVAVKLFQNRNSTEDVDCLLDPNVDAAKDYRTEFIRAVRHVAKRNGHDEDWLNDEVRTFIHSSKRHDLFLESVDQDITIYHGCNLVIFAGKMEWALETKIRRIANRREPRPKDIDDALALVNFIIMTRNIRALSGEYLKRLNRNGFDVAPMERGVRMVAEKYTEVYGQQGITL